MIAVIARDLVIGKAKAKDHRGDTEAARKKPCGEKQKQDPQHRGKEEAEELKVQVKRHKPQVTAETQSNSKTETEDKSKIKS